jgi:hypothetical protein
LIEIIKTKKKNSEINKKFFPGKNMGIKIPPVFLNLSILSKENILNYFYARLLTFLQPQQIVPVQFGHPSVVENLLEAQ